MSKQYSYIERRIPATPRNKRLTDSIVAAASTGGGYIGGGGGTSYWQLVTTDADGNALAEEDQYLVPIGAYPVVSLSDVVAYATANPVANTPVTGYDTFGLVKIASGCGLIVTDGVLSIDPSAVGGLDQEALASYLTLNKYVKEDDLATKGYLMLSSPLTGYVIADEYTAISPTDTVLTAIGKMERRFDGYVDLTTDQTIGGVKIFTETIYGNKDVVCYATSSAVATTSVASKSSFGLVKIGDNITVVDGVISAVAQQSGVQFTPGTALELTENSVLNVKLGTTLNTACAGNDSRLSDARKCPYSLSWSGYSSGSYDGSGAKSFSIPSNTNQLTNGAGFISDGNGNFTTLSGSGNSSKYLAGNGQFYTIAASEISFPYGYVTLSTSQTITAQKTFKAGMITGDTSGVYLQFSNGNGIVGYNAENGVVSYIYLNYRSTLDYTRVTGSNDIETTGDIVAYAESSAVATTPVASTSVFGLVKIGSGISVSDGVISAVAQQSGVQFTPGTALELTANSVLNVKLGTTSNTVCAGNDSRLSDARVCPYSLSWSGYNSGSYNGSASKTISIPSNTNQLTNGAGFISDGNGNFTTLVGSGNNTQYLAGNGQFYTIEASEISFPNGYVTLSTVQTITAQKWFSGKIVVGPTNNVHLRLGEGSGNCINGYKADDSTMWNIYLNYEDSSAYTLVDPSHNMITTGDVVAYATSSAVANTPVASTTTFGLVKIGSGISVSGGVISVSVSGGSSSWDGGTVGNDITILKSNPTLRLSASNNTVGVWSMQNNTTNNLCFYNSKFSGICAQVDYTSGAWTGNSDVRLKIIDGYETDILNKIYSIDIIYYYWKFGVTNRRMIGVSAQDIRQVLPELVNVVGYNDNIKDYTLGLDYATLGAVVAIGGLKELYALHLRLANEVRSVAHWRLTKDEQIRQLQRECAELRVRINELEKGVAA